MGGLPFMNRAREMSFCSLAWVLVACDANEHATTAPQSRAAAVQAPPGAGGAPQPAASASGRPESAPPPRKAPLCADQLAKKAVAMPELDVSRAGEPEPPPSLEVAGGKWTWINFWAAWCVPCKQEIPLLREWEAALGSKLRLQFVSLDDDERQLREFLKAQPASGVKGTYWLRDGKERQEWLTAVGMDADPQLPAHVLVDPTGHVRCTIEGAVEPSDLPRVKQLVDG